MGSHRVHDGPMRIHPRGRISRGYFSDKIFIIRRARGGEYERWRNDSRFGEWEYTLSLISLIPYGRAVP